MGGVYEICYTDIPDYFLVKKLILNGLPSKKYQQYT